MIYVPCCLLRRSKDGITYCLLALAVQDLHMFAGSLLGVLEQEPLPRVPLTHDAGLEVHRVFATSI